MYLFLREGAGMRGGGAEAVNCSKLSLPIVSQGGGESF